MPTTREPLVAVPDAFDRLAVHDFVDAVAPRVWTALQRGGISVSRLAVRVDHSAIIELENARVATENGLSDRALYPEEQVVVQRAIAEQSGIARLSAHATRFVQKTESKPLRQRAATALQARLRAD